MPEVIEESPISAHDRPLLVWLASQPGGAVTMTAAGVGRAMGWSRQRTARRLDSLVKAGLVIRRGGVITLNRQRTLIRTIIREVGGGADKSAEAGVTEGVTNAPEKAARVTRKRPMRETHVDLQPQAQTPFLSAPEIPPVSADSVADTRTEIPSTIPHQDTAEMWPFTQTKATPVAATVAPASSPVAKYNVDYQGAHGAIPSTYAEHLDWRPASKSEPAAAKSSSPGFDATDAFGHATTPEKLFLIIALGLSAVAAYVSVYYGMTVLFPAAGTTIIVLGGFIEGAKFLGFGVVSAGWNHYTWLGKWVVSLLLVLAALVNAAAVYGWLISSHVGPNASRSATYAQNDAGAAAGMETAQAKVNDLDKQIGRMDADISTAQNKRQNATANRLREQRKQLSAQRDTAQRELSGIKAGRAVTAAKNGADEASALPIRYAAQLFEDVGLIAPGTDPEKLLRWLAFMILCCGDPLALAGVFMVSSRARRAS